VVEGVYSAVRSDSLCKADYVSSLKGSLCQYRDARLWDCTWFKTAGSLHEYCVEHSPQREIYFENRNGHFEGYLYPVFRLFAIILLTIFSKFDIHGSVHRSMTQ